MKYSDVAEGKEQEEPYTISFNPCTEEWQFVSLTFSKEQFRPVESVKIYCDYSYNSGEVFFDDVQLVRSFLETGLTAEDFETEETEEDTTEDTTEKGTSEEFEEAKDTFGNTLTQTVFEEGKEGVLYSSYQYSPDGNHLIGETDNRGNQTTYTVDAETSRNTEVTDRCGNKTAYEYDAAGRTTKVTSKKADGTEVAHVEYSYDSLDNLTEIRRGDGMAYTLQYNPFHNLESIGVKNGNNLAQYTYKDGNGRLKEVTYANGHTMKIRYDRFGNMTEEKWFASDESVMAHYKYTYDRQGNMIRSLDILQNFLYDYEYRDGHMVQEVQSAVTLNSDHVITAKTMIHTVTYRYNEDGQLLKKTILSAANEVEQVLTYTYPEEEEPILSITVGGRTIACQSETDHLNRKVRDQVGPISRSFTYHAGAMTAEHQASGKIKGSAATQLVSRITLSDGRTLSYEYDKEERITKVIDSVEGTTEYTYDALGQLLTETKNGSPVNTMTYDNYGNILTKNGKQYCYEDSIWKDKLTCYDG